MTWKDAKLVPGWSDTTLVSDSVGAADTNTHKYVQKRKGKKPILSSRQLGRYLNKFASCSYAFIRSMRGKKRIIALMNIMIFPVIAFSFISLTASTSEFCYDEGHCDPYSWGDSYPTCHPLLESHHSPINLDHDVTRDQALEALQLEGFDSVQKGQWRLRNDGHTVVLEVGSGMTVSGGGLPGTYSTLQLHFHWGSLATNGSEHTIHTYRLPMEMHIVNMKTIHPNLTSAMEDQTGLAVLAVFIDVSYTENANFTPITTALSSVAHRGQSVAIRPFPLASLLPQDHLGLYYRYHGSLTTPPCSQVVVWSVYEVPVHISWSQYERFAVGVFSTEEETDQDVLLQNNFRHVHLTYSRRVYASKDAQLLGAACPAAAPGSGLLLLSLLPLLLSHMDPTPDGS
ncbi:carbonic anhydrase 15 [Clupea harengus]|uniref:carbonic anhydrase n=1 Tax=Clupea harengus TaxID=7950 RepID=A0A6P8G2S2_CLUHA|nr:carbonic anhydrase 15 [Clupea harengus]